MSVSHSTSPRAAAQLAQCAPAFGSIMLPACGMPGASRTRKLKRTPEREGKKASALPVGAAGASARRNEGEACSTPITVSGVTQAEWNADSSCANAIASRNGTIR